MRNLKPACFSNITHRCFLLNLMQQPGNNKNNLRIEICISRSLRYLSAMKWLSMQSSRTKGRIQMWCSQINKKNLKQVSVYTVKKWCNVITWHGIELAASWQCFNVAVWNAVSWRFSNRYSKIYFWNLMALVLQSM